MAFIFIKYKKNPRPVKQYTALGKYEHKKPKGVKAYYE